MSIAAFAKEAPKSQLPDHLAPLHTFKPCHCPPHPSSRVPNCTCDPSTTTIIPAPVYVSPLFSVRWKRLVVDEGHIHGDDKTRASQLANLLSVERRWLVSGTPTTDLLGLGFGSASEATEMDGNDDADEEADLGGLMYPEDDGPQETNSEEELAQPDSPRQSAILDLGVSEDSTAAITSDVAETGLPSARIWTPRDRENLRRLGKMISSFLKVEEFSNLEGTRMFNELVVSPLFGENGPQLRAVQVLKQVMGSVMIRHRYVIVLSALISVRGT